LPTTTETDRLRIMWTAFGASEDGPDDEFFRRMSAPENEIPVAVPLNTVLGRNEDAAVALVGVQVYTTGVSFELAVRLRSPLEPMHHGLNELLFDHGPSAPGRLLLGVELADGRTASNVHGRGGSGGVVFHAGGGGGGELSVDQTWWLHPLPPEGPLRLVLSCAALGIEETSAVLDGAILRRAAADVVTLWPWTPPDRGERPPPPPPDLPDDSWFVQPH
jgi:hypothetical protein